MRIVIAYDGSACAQEAIVDLARAGLPQSGEALVLYVRSEGSRDEQGSCADEGATRLRALMPDWNVVAETCSGSVAWEIIRRGEGRASGAQDATAGWGQSPADLILIGSRGYGGLLGPLKSWVLGSVSHRVLMASRCSVRVARGDHFRAGAAHSNPSRRPPRIVIGVDGSSDSIAAVQAVALREWPPATQVLIVHYWSGFHEAPQVPVVWGGDQPSREPASPYQAEALAVATHAATMLRNASPALHVTTLVKVGDPKYTILEDAREWGDRGADCIFVGARGIGKLERFLLGSVSTAVAMHAHCSVEVVHPSAQD